MDPVSNAAFDDHLCKQLEKVVCDCHRDFRSTLRTWLEQQGSVIYSLIEQQRILECTIRASLAAPGSGDSLHSFSVADCDSSPMRQGRVFDEKSLSPTSLPHTLPSSVLDYADTDSVPRRERSKSSAQISQHSTGKAPSVTDHSQFALLRKGATLRKKHAAVGFAENDQRPANSQKIKPRKTTRSDEDSHERRKSMMSVFSGRSPTHPISWSESLKGGLLHRTWIKRCVNSTSFTVLIAVLIVCHAVSMGIQLEYRSSAIFMVLEIFFALVFLFEISIRMVAEGRDFFCARKNRTWNVFDTTITIGSAFEVFVNLDENDNSPLALLRILRVIRVAKVLRVFRLVRVFRSLRIMVFSIFSTMKTLAWALLLMSIILYVFAIVFVQAANEPTGLASVSDHTRAELKRFYPSTFHAMFTLFKAISGGEDWGEFVAPLTDVSLAYTFLFTAYVSLMSFAVMNVITGHFCHMANESAEKDHEHVLAEYVADQSRLGRMLRAIFAEVTCGDPNAVMTLITFEKCLQDPRMQGFFATMKIQMSDAWSIFKLLDSDGSHDVDLDEFVAGCLRLRGPAKSIDLANVMHQIEWFSNRLVHFIAYSEQEFQTIACKIERWGYRQLVRPMGTKSGPSSPTSLPLLPLASATNPRAEGSKAARIAELTSECQSSDGFADTRLLCELRDSGKQTLPL